MASILETRDFDSWLQALHAEQLTTEQLAVLQQMVEQGQAETLERAAQLLDWQESVIDPIEHLYGL
ncbi:MAG: hypothetical protein KF832_08900 [Caldilineaceae bacterium]|nr:hypothetical protein [Caldilineaceae bacterium]